jgi:hypothetical protein
VKAIARPSAATSAISVPTALDHSDSGSVTEAWSDLTHLCHSGQKSPAYLGHAGTVVGAIPSLSQVAAVPALHVLSRSLG